MLTWLSEYQGQICDLPNGADYVECRAWAYNGGAGAQPLVGVRGKTPEAEKRPKVKYLSDRSPRVQGRLLLIATTSLYFWSFGNAGRRALPIPGSVPAEYVCVLVLYDIVQSVCSSSMSSASFN